ncbi:MAG: dihydropteroate synthase [Candidatus Eisenbacteria bacterium]|uniref:Dihydropteroate synthase n=1 Tax=Eiseniibacteriota bacterium TaxID=2212470 RepID=A0A937XB97_UNCEI|nr:dihydropteroate synthase [Candidatus Eisenbacteria bacterium]
MADAAPSRPLARLRLGDREFELGRRTLVAGILNCTPDSFFDGGLHAGPREAVARYHQMAEEGADWIDLGGESTRPGAEPVPALEEWRRVEPVCAAARRAGHPLPLSIDTTKAEVAERALDAGAAIVNDVSALRFDPRLAALAARYRAGLILMHMRGEPRSMQREPRYGDVVAEVRDELAAALRAAAGRGVDEARVVIDPGIGFGKTVAHNLEILRRLGEFSLLGRPVMVGCSRKSFIGAVCDAPPPERLEGTLAAHVAAALAGAHVVRVHDVAAHRRALALADALLGGPPES